MPSERKFHRTMVMVEVLSAKPFAFEDLGRLHYACVREECSSQMTVDIATTIDGPMMAKRLIAQDSDPGSFMLTEEGDELE